MSSGQTRRGSLAEAAANTILGLGVAFVANLLVLPVFGLPVSASKAAGISAVFVAVSLVRSYCLRRLFERLRGRGFFS